MNHLDPRSIIYHSRNLEGVGVDIGEDQGDAAFMEKRLGEIKQFIDKEPQGTLRHAHLVERYNTLLYILVNYLEYEQRCLQRSDEIAEHLMLLEYVEYKRTLQEQGLYTLPIKMQRSKIVALIRVLAVSWWGQGNQIKIQPIEIFKGALKKKEKVSVCAGWGNIYKKQHKYLVFYDDVNSKGLVTYSSTNRMPLIEEKQELYIVSPYGQSFWPVSCRKKSDFYTLVSWESVKEWLRTHCSIKNSRSW